MFSLPSNRQTRPLVVGEVLFDCFPDGRDVIGGAPFNVAWNLHGFGRQPQFVSAVGSDDLGRKVRSTMSTWGLDPGDLAEVDGFPTGQVTVTLDNGQPSYEIAKPVAWDFIPLVPESFDFDAISIVYHGSLLMRHQVSRASLRDLIHRVNAQPQVARFVDLNLREPWFDVAWLGDLLGGAELVKLNEIELAQITGLPCTTSQQVQSAASKLAADYSLADSAAVIVTSGAQGAYVVAGQTMHFTAATRVARLVDTVGAGDAFAAATIDGLIAGADYPAILKRAVEFAGRVCQQRGATTTVRSVYELDTT